MGADEIVYAGLSDKDLLSKAKDSDREAFNQLHKRYRERILNYVYRLLGNYQVAEEITQETFIRVYTNLATCRLESVSGWIYTIARNLSMNELRRSKHEPTMSIYEPVSEKDGEESLLIDYLSEEAYGYETGARQRELEQRVESAINSLPLKYREVMILCGMQGLSYEEAAQALKCSVRNIGVRIFRARKLMRKLYFK